MTTAEYAAPLWGSARRDEAPQPRRDGGMVHELLRRDLRGPAPRGEAPRPDPSRGRLPPARAAAGAGSPDPRRPLRLRPPRGRPRPARLPGGRGGSLPRDDRGGASSVRGAATAHLRAGRHAADPVPRRVRRGGQSLHQLRLLHAGPEPGGAAAPRAGAAARRHAPRRSPGPGLRRDAAAPPVVPRGLNPFHPGGQAARSPHPDPPEHPARPPPPAPPRPAPAPPPPPRR